MNKLFIIIKREYLSKVSKKSFIVLTILGPVLLALLITLPIIISNNSQETYNITVVDSTPKTIINGDTISFFEGKFRSNEMVNFSYSKDIAMAQKNLKDGKTDMVLEIVKSNDAHPIKTFSYFADNEPSLETKEDVKSQTEQIFKNSILMVNYNMSKEDIGLINNPQIDSYTTDIRTGEESFSDVKIIVGAILAFMIYMFIFMFGGQIMRSVSEEKTSKIVEVLVSSVKSIHLLFGKIIAVALVGLTQLALWVVLTLLIVGGINLANPNMFKGSQPEQITLNERVITADKVDATNLEGDTVAKTINQIKSVNIPLVLSMFVIYFLLGYLLYGSLFGAVGSLVDDDADAGQFTLPLTVPLIFAMICIPIIVENPSGSLSAWLSIIPFTSPMVMLMRIPYGVAIWQILLSIGLLIITIIGSMYVSAKIYRTGILTYGRQIKYKDLFKWIKYKQ